MLSGAPTCVGPSRLPPETPSLAPSTPPLLRAQAKRILGDPGFMRSLEDFDKDNIPEGVVRKLKRFVDDPSFTPGGP